MSRCWLLIAGFLPLLSGCSGLPRMIVLTGTTLGLHVTPGDGSSQPPQVTLAYKRYEGALIPTGDGVGERPVKDDVEASTTASSTPKGKQKDLFAAVTAFRFSTLWIGRTELDSIIATGHAARNLAAPTPPPASAPTTGKSTGTKASSSASVLSADKSSSLAPQKSADDAGKLADAIKKAGDKYIWDCKTAGSKQ